MDVANILGGILWFALGFIKIHKLKITGDAQAKKA